jgi:hypothetical protein
MNELAWLRHLLDHATARDQREIFLIDDTAMAPNRMIRVRPGLLGMTTALRPPQYSNPRATVVTVTCADLRAWLRAVTP